MKNKTAAASPWKKKNGAQQHTAMIPSAFIPGEATKAKEIPAARTKQQLWLSDWCILSPLGSEGNETSVAIAARSLFLIRQSEAEDFCF